MHGDQQPVAYDQLVHEAGDDPAKQRLVEELHQRGDRELRTFTGLRNRNIDPSRGMYVFHELPPYRVVGYDEEGPITIPAPEVLDKEGHVVLDEHGNAVRSNAAMWEIDENGRRVRGAMNYMGMLPDTPRSDYNQRKANQQGFGGAGGDAGGHLIARMFGGPKEMFNLVPMAGSLNNGAWANLENHLKDAIENGQEVHMDVEAHYGAGGDRPTHFDVNYVIDGQQHSVSYQNQ